MNEHRIWFKLLDDTNLWKKAADEAHLLSPMYTNATSCDPVFGCEYEQLQADFNQKESELDTSDHGMLRGLSVMWQCELGPGQVLFVPAGCPHMVENLSDTVALSSKYIDESNLDKSLSALGVHARSDHLAQQLHQQLEAIAKDANTECVTDQHAPWAEFKRVSPRPSEL